MAFGLGRQGGRGAGAALAAAAAFGGGIAIGLLAPAAGSAPAAAGAVSLRAQGGLPPWLAPGAPLTVAGWARPLAQVALLADGRRVATARSGSLGRVEIRAR